MSMRTLLASLLLVGIVWLPSHAEESPSTSEQESYEAYLKSNQEMYAAYQKNIRIATGVLVLVVTGVVVFAIPAASRRTRRVFELAERQQKILEEIRDLLKKP